MTADATASAARRRRPEMVSVVVPARNAARALEAQLEALRTQDYGDRWEVIVVDDGSTDGTGDVARRWQQALPLRVVDVPGGRGASVARNRGWRSARGDLIAFCDADDVVSPGWLKHLTEAAAEVDLVGGPYEFGRLNTSGAAPWWNGAGLPLGLDFLPFVVGGNLAIWSEILAVLGGFNESYARQQDVELSWRAHRASLSLGFAPGAVVHCRERTRFADLAVQAYRSSRQHPHLYRDFRADGMPRASLWTFALAVGSLVVRAPASILSESRRRRWTLSACHRLGRLAGSVHYRVLYL